jgi:hypothetical protein
VLEFRVLRPVQAVRDGRELALGGPRRRAVLALLLVAGGRVVPAERLASQAGARRLGYACWSASALRSILTIVWSRFQAMVGFCCTSGRNSQ